MSGLFVDIANILSRYWIIKENVSRVMFLCRSAIKRNAWCAPVCLGLHKKPHFAHFTNKAIDGGMAGLVTEERDDTSELQCFPFARFPNISPCQVPTPSPLPGLANICPLSGSPNNSTHQDPQIFPLDIPALKISPHQHSPRCGQPDCQLPQP